MGAKYSKTVVVDEGITWVACNPAPGTGINYTAVGTFSTVTAMFTWQNLGLAGGKVIYPEKIRLLTTTAPTFTAGTGTLQCAVVLDNTSRAPSAANSTITPSNAYSTTTSTVSSVAMFNVFNANQMTVPTWGASKRIVGRGSIPVGIAVPGDAFIFQFGADADVGSTPLLTTTRSIQPATFVTNLPECGIGPGHFAVFHLWMPGFAVTTIPAFEYEVTWWEA